MKSKLLLFAAATGLAIAASASTFAAGTSSPLDAKSVAQPTLVPTYAEATVATVQIKPSATVAVNYIAGAKVDFKTVADVKVLSDPDWKTISAMRGVIDDGPATLKTALVGSAQGGGCSGCFDATTTLAASSSSHSSAPAANGYTTVDLAKLTKPDGSVTRVTT